MARLYANENFPLPVVLKLRQLGHDVLTVQETGKAGLAMPDEAVLAFATGDARADNCHRVGELTPWVVTGNVYFV